MDLRQIQYFLSLYEEKSVTRAARLLNIVQPALSMQIAKLERDVGRPLFIRTSRGMLPTPAADEMYELFTPILSEFSRVRSRVVQDRTALSGHVRIGAIASVGHDALPSALLSFTATHPQVTLSVTEGMTAALSERVANGQLDLAVVNRPKQAAGLAVELIFTEPILLVSQGSNHPGWQTEIQASELPALRFIMPTRNHGLRQMLDDGLDALNVVLTPALEVDSLLTQTLLVSQGQFVALLPESIIRNVQVRTGIRLRTQRLKEPSLQREMVWVRNARHPTSPAAQAFRQILTTSLLKTITASLKDV